MTQQVEVRLSNGGSHFLDACGWFSREDGALDVLAANSSESVATFARGEWAFVSKVVIEGQVDEKLSVGNLTIDLDVEGAEVLRNSIAENLEDLAAKELWRDRGAVPGMKAAAYMIRNGLV